MCCRHTLCTAFALIEFSRHVPNSEIFALVLPFVWNIHLPKIYLDNDLIFFYYLLKSYLHLRLVLITPCNTEICPTFSHPSFPKTSALLYFFLLCNFMCNNLYKVYSLFIYYIWCLLCVSSTGMYVHQRQGFRLF